VFEKKEEEKAMGSVKGRRREKEGGRNQRGKHQLRKKGVKIRSQGVDRPVKGQKRGHLLEKRRAENLGKSVQRRKDGNL